MKTLQHIANELASYDPQALTASMVNDFLAKLVEPVTAREELGVFDALGRVLAADIVSPISVPPHDNSAMDGYAFDGAQLASGAPLTLKVVGTALAGKAWVGTVAPGECVKIMTGAIMPVGLNTVAPQELVQASTDTAGVTHIALPAGALQTGDNRRFKGEDLMQGQPALQKGELLTPAALGLVASLGIKTMAVLRRLRVAYFSTGDEILSLGEPPREGAVYDSNRYTVFGLLTRLGCEVIDMGVVRDQPEALEAAFVQAALQADAIITSGGVSVGEADFTKAMMKKLGDVAFWKIAMRPGRPMAVGHILRDKLASSPYIISASSYLKDSKSIHQPAGAIQTDVLEYQPPPQPSPSGGGSQANSQRLGNGHRVDVPSPAGGRLGWGLAAEPLQFESHPQQAHPATANGLDSAEVASSETAAEASAGNAVLFGLPGNPVAVMVTFLAFVRPALLRMMGATASAPPLLKAKSTEAIRKKPGRTEYQRGIVSSAADGSLQVQITGNQGSGVLNSMVRANGLIVLHHAQGNVTAGDEVDVMMFDGVI